MLSFYAEFSWNGIVFCAAKPGFAKVAFTLAT
jgi:hypothetical protein